MNLDDGKEKPPCLTIVQFSPLPDLRFHMITRIIVTSTLCALQIAACVTTQSSSFGDDVVTMSHGPILGRPAATSMTVWARTTRPSKFEVRFGTDPQKLDSSALAQTTELADDNTGYITLPDLKPATTYWTLAVIARCMT